LRKILGFDFIEEIARKDSENLIIKIRMLSTLEVSSIKAKIF